MKEALAALANWCANRNCNDQVVVILNKRTYDEFAKELEPDLISKDDSIYATGIMLHSTGPVVQVMHA